MNRFSRLPNHESIFVIGDVHGCADELHALLSKLPLKRPCTLVLIGDYIDRGPNSREVIETVMALPKTLDVYALLGNHEALLVDFIDRPTSDAAAAFIFNGGGATLQSYSDNHGNFSFPSSHVEFVRGLPLACESEKEFFVHAGVPDVDIEHLDAGRHRRDLLWIREPFLRSDFAWGKTVVHGHTPCPNVHLDGRRINVDTGCAYDNKLSAVHLPTLQIYEVRKAASTEHVFLRDGPRSRRRAVRFAGVVLVVVELEQASVRFATINFNDFGLLIQPEETLPPQALTSGQSITGTICTSGSEDFIFTGTVVRVERMSFSSRYAVRFQNPPKRIDKASEDDPGHAGGQP